MAHWILNLLIAGTFLLGQGAALACSGSCAFSGSKPQTQANVEKGSARGCPQHQAKKQVKKADSAKSDGCCSHKTSNSDTKSGGSNGECGASGHPCLMNSDLGEVVPAAQTAEPQTNASDMTVLSRLPDAFWASVGPPADVPFHPNITVPLPKHPRFIVLRTLII